MNTTNDHATMHGNSEARPASDEFLSLLVASPQIDHCFDALMGSLYQLSGAHPLKTVLVTSTQPEEGKTTVVLSLAIKMALARKATLIIDADCRKPRVHRILSLENENGLSTISGGQAGPLAYVHRVELPHTGTHLDVLTSGKGPATPFSGDGRHNLQAVIEEVKRQYDMVLIDSPPVLAVSDAMFLAPLVDGIILVLNTGTVSERDARVAKRRLEEAGGHLFGAVMNCFDESLHGAGFNPYHRYYAGKK